MWSISARSVIARFYVGRPADRSTDWSVVRQTWIDAYGAHVDACLLLVPAALIAGQGRYARLGDFDGTVEVQLDAADPWMPAERNLPLPESAWIRTGAASRVEIELDEGSAWRLGPDSQGGAVRLHAPFHRTARDAAVARSRPRLFHGRGRAAAIRLLLVVPGAQVIVTKRRALRLEARANCRAQLAVLQGVARFSSPAAEIDLAQGQTTRVEPAQPDALLSLSRSYAARPGPLERRRATRRWPRRCRRLHVPQRYGLADLDAAGQWIQTGRSGHGLAAQGGRRLDAVSRRPLALVRRAGLHLGERRIVGLAALSLRPLDAQGELGWVWAPSSTAVFKPAEVYLDARRSSAAGGLWRRAKIGTGRTCRPSF